MQIPPDTHDDPSNGGLTTKVSVRYISALAGSYSTHLIPNNLKNENDGLLPGCQRAEIGSGEAGPRRTGDADVERIDKGDRELAVTRPQHSSSEQRYNCTSETVSSTIICSSPCKDSQGEEMKSVEVEVGSYERPDHDGPVQIDL